MSGYPSRLKVLAIAEEANPEWVSVPLIGWSLANALRDVADVHLVTQVRNRDAILRAGLQEGTDFTAIDSEAVARPMHKFAGFLRMEGGKGWTINTAINSISYNYFEHLVWKRFGARIRAGDYDIVHRITPLSPTVPSSIAPKAAAAGTPFLIGPLNGGVPWPKGFDAERRNEREWLSYVRNIYKLNPQRSRTLKAARVIFAGSRHTQNEIPQKYRVKSVWLPENAIDPARFNMVAAQDFAKSLRGCFIGRLVPYKGPDMLLEAAAPLLRSGRLALDIIGDGPMMGALREQAQRQGLAEAVVFHGNLEHTKVQSVAVKSNLLTFPSIREFGGGVVLEAMALGVVPLIVDYAGPGELVVEGTGYKVPIGTRDQIISKFREKLESIADDPSELREISARARDYALKYYTWAAKSRQVLEVYEKVMSNEPAPDALIGPPDALPA